MMSKIFGAVLSLSLSGSVLILIVFIVSRLFGKQLRHHWRYYIWIVVVLRLVFPFGPENGLISRVAQVVAEPPTIVSTEEAAREPGQAGGVTFPPTLSENMPQQSAQEPHTVPVENTGTTLAKALSIVADWLWLLWLLGMVILFIRKITLYQSFVKYIRAGNMEISDPELLNLFGEVCEEVGINRRVELSFNNLVASPLMMGFHRPMIVLPGTSWKQEELRYVLLHELTHLKRRDIFYKWLMQLVLCLHWFNPLVHLMVREVNRACELSCDASVSRRLSKKQRTEYGQTLLASLDAPGHYREGVAAVTLSESAAQLKERLEAIVEHQKLGKGVVFIAAFLAVLLFGGGYALGTHSITSQAEITPMPNEGETSKEVDNDDTPELNSHKVHILPVLQEFIIAYENGDVQGADYDLVLEYAHLPIIESMDDFSLSENEMGFWATIPIDAEWQLSVLISHFDDEYRVSGAKINIDPDSFTSYAMMRGLSFEQVRTLLNSSLTEAEILTMPVEELRQIFSRLTATDNVDDRGFVTLDYVELLNMEGDNPVYVYSGGKYLGWTITQALAVGIPYSPYIIEAESVTVTMQGEAQVSGSFRWEDDVLIFTVADESAAIMPTCSCAPSREIMISNAGEVAEFLEPIAEGSQIRFILGDYSISYTSKLSFDASGDPLVEEPRLLQQAELISLG